MQYAKAVMMDVVAGDLAYSVFTSPFYFSNLMFNEPAFPKSGQIGKEAKRRLL